MTHPLDVRAWEKLKGRSLMHATLPQPVFDDRMMLCSLLSLGCVFGFAPPEETAALTALRALRIAQRRLRPDVRSKLLSVSSPHTDSSLVPEAWRFVFHDPGTSGKSRAVTVAARTSSEHPDTVEAFAGLKGETATGQHVIAQNKWLVDSNAALEKVRGEFKVKHVHSAQYRLSRSSSGRDPFWTIDFFGEKDEILVRFRIDARTGDLRRLAIDEGGE
jgi:hypothetical protein